MAMTTDMAMIILQFICSMIHTSGQAISLEKLRGTWSAASHLAKPRTLKTTALNLQPIRMAL